MLNKFYIEPVLFKTNNLSHVKFIHSTNVLLMDKPNSQSNPDNIPEVDANKMLNGLDEIAKNSDSKTVSDIISEETSSFDEAFPNYNKGKINSSVNTNIEGDSLPGDESFNHISKIINEYHNSEVLKNLIDEKGLSNIILKFKNGNKESSLDLKNIKEFFVGNSAIK